MRRTRHDLPLDETADGVTVTPDAASIACRRSRPHPECSSDHRGTPRALQSLTDIAPGGRLHRVSSYTIVGTWQLPPGQVGRRLFDQAESGGLRVALEARLVARCALSSTRRAAATSRRGAERDGRSGRRAHGASNSRPWRRRWRGRTCMPMTPAGPPSCSIAQVRRSPEGHR
jgi:hypothetical protein